MWQGNYRKRLEVDLRRWVEQGWVGAEQQQQILSDLGPQAESHNFATRAFILMGVLLFGSGVITFFATNWQEMSRLAKLSLLFGSLWSSYLLAYFLGRDDRHISLSQGMLLLGVILFGANIMLIAQIYHIDHHYPDGVMWWAIGALLVAVLMRSQAVMVAALALAVLWSSMEQFDFGRAVFWPFLVFLALALPSVIRHHWPVALKVALLGLLYWSFVTFLELDSWGSDWQKGAQIYLLQIYFLAYLGLYVLAGWAELQWPVHAAMSTVRAFAAFAVLGSFYLLTFPDLLDLAKAPSAGWQSGNGVALLVAGAIAALRYRREPQNLAAMPLYRRLGFGLMLGMMVYIILNLFWVHKQPELMALLANLVYFAALVWLVYAGVKMRHRSLVNLAFFFFAITLLARYFDTFWTLMNRSFFFMGGGLLLIGGGWLLERQRRKLTAVIQGPQGEGEA